MLSDAKHSFVSFMFYQLVRKLALFFLHEAYHRITFRMHAVVLWNKIVVECGRGYT